MSHPKRRNKIDGQFNARTLKMMESPAYRALSLSARRVMDRICIELMHHGGNDNGKLPVTYEHFVEYGIARHAIAPAIREARMKPLVLVRRGSLVDWLNMLIIRFILSLFCFCFLSGGSRLTG